MNRTLLAAGILGASAVALGAYAAHGLEGLISGLGYDGGELARRVENFETGARYQLHAAAALLAIGLVSGPNKLRGAATALAAGALIFCGLLYALAFVGEGWKWLGAIVPLGGLAMIVGWAWIAVSAFGAGKAPSEEQGKDSQALDEGLIRLEELLSHQQLLLQELDDTVTGLRRDADTNVLRVNRIESATRRLFESQTGGENPPDERPPHY